ncbi:MAG: enoyl-CoA hydratase-related protein [Pseudomonadota bacterium]
MSDTVLYEQRGRVALLTLNRPKALNAINTELLDTLTEHLARLERDPGIGAIVLQGSEKAFAAGADIKEMKDLGYADVAGGKLFTSFDKIRDCRTPIIAAVSGFALGGGCELAMAADMIFASETAQFGQPEIKLGVVPGMGGTQRLLRAVGKARAMDLILTGRNISAVDAEAAGLVARVLPLESLLETALAAAETIAGYSAPVVEAAKDCVNRAEELSLGEGLDYEKAVFQGLFALDDKTEGMRAFAEKRPPVFKHR